MRQLVAVGMRLHTRLERSRFGGDLLAALAGFGFFSFTVGVKKLNPRNVEWLVYDDQVMHWMGWLSFANDQWRWPLGSNPNLGWERANSIVFTDSWPGLALIFKAVNLDAVDAGQFFGIGLFLGSLALFVGGGRLFRGLGCSTVTALIASGLLATTPIFWWMQRWYAALAAGLPTLVWAIHFYFDDRRNKSRFLSRWVPLTVIALATHAYLVVLIVPFLLGIQINRVRCRRSRPSAVVLQLMILGGVNTAVAYQLGYLTIPSKWAQTGGYGWYSANLLWLFDLNEASQFVPNFPSLSGQYEPTALGLGSVLLLVIAVLSGTYRSKAGFHFRLIRSHMPLLCLLGGFMTLAVSNTVSIGDWSVRIPLPMKIENALSIFRSSARFVWPLLILVIVALVLIVVRSQYLGRTLLTLGLLLQITDSYSAMSYVRQLPDGPDSVIPFDEQFWAQIPKSYEVLAGHPARNTGLEWTQCMYAAVRTSRVGQCGFFARVQGLENVNRNQSEALLKGELEANTIYWISIEWLRENRASLRTTYPEDRLDVMIVHGPYALSVSEALIVPDCETRSKCRFLGAYTTSLGSYVRNL